MRGETIDDTYPGRGGIPRDRALPMAHKLRFGPGRPHGRGNPWSGCDLKIRHQRLRPLPHVFKFHPLAQPRLHGPCGMRPFIRLNAGLLIRAHAMDPGCLQGWGLLIQRADGLDVGVNLVRVLRALMIEPIARVMRL